MLIFLIYSAVSIKVRIDGEYWFCSLESRQHANTYLYFINNNSNLSLVRRERTMDNTFNLKVLNWMDENILSNIKPQLTPY